MDNLYSAADLAGPGRMGPDHWGPKIARDIPERQEAESKLHESDHLLAAILAAIYANDAACRITSYNTDST